MALAVIFLNHLPAAPVLAISGAAGFVGVATLLLLSTVAFAGWSERARRRLKAEYKRLRADLTKANERAASLRGEKTQILRIAMQDLVAPVSELSANVEELSQRARSPETDAAVEEVRENLGRMRRALAALNELQALEDRSRSLILTGVNVGAVLLEAVSNQRAAADRKRVRLSVPAPSRTTLARADADVLRKVFENLIRDGVEVSPSGSTVSISVYQTADRVLITVGDEGPGATVNDQAQLLSQSGHSRPPMGAGHEGPRLNLGMVHNLVKAMDGWLWTQAEPGRGTTHVVELSLAQVPRGPALFPARA